MFLFIGTSNEQFNKPKITVLVLISKISAFGHDREMFYQYQNFSKFQKYAKISKFSYCSIFTFCFEFFQLPFFLEILFFHSNPILPIFCFNLTRTHFESSFFRFFSNHSRWVRKKNENFLFLYFASKKSDSLDANSNWWSPTLSVISDFEMGVLQLPNFSILGWSSSVHPKN